MKSLQAAYAASQAALSLDDLFPPRREGEEWAFVKYEQQPLPDDQGEPWTKEDCRRLFESQLIPPSTVCNISCFRIIYMKLKWSKKEKRESGRTKAYK